MLVRNGATRLTKPLTEIHIPPTVHGILASRIDALSASEKGLLQTLAVIGKTFPLNLIRHVTATPDDQLEPLLKGLQVGEFIYEQPALGEAEYTFKHALTQEVAYHSILAERRKKIHERVGAVRSRRFFARSSKSIWQNSRITTGAAQTPREPQSISSDQPTRQRSVLPLSRRKRNIAMPYPL